MELLSEHADHSVRRNCLRHAVVRARANGALHVPWQRAPSTRRREIFLPKGILPQHARPIRSETRATLVAAIARGRRWLDELTTEPSVTTESIAKRENCSVRKVNMTISLAFLSPALVKAAIDGRLPHRMALPVSPTYHPNGPGSTRCSAFRRTDQHSKPGLR